MQMERSSMPTAWSCQYGREHFYKLLYRHQGEEITIEDADPETLGTLVRAMYEKEVSPIYTIFIHKRMIDQSPTNPAT